MDSEQPKGLLNADFQAYQSHMMGLADKLKSLMSRITIGYFPLAIKWGFVYNYAMYPHQCLLFKMEYQVFDSHSTDVPRVIDIRSDAQVDIYLIDSFIRDPQFLVHWLHRKMLEACTHEIDEWLKLDGCNHHDPHPPPMFSGCTVSTVDRQGPTK